MIYLYYYYNLRIILLYYPLTREVNKIQKILSHVYSSNKKKTNPPETTGDTLNLHLIFLLGVHLSTTDPTGPTGRDKTDFPTGRSASLHRGSLTDVLVVTTTVRMFNGVHGHTTYLWPAVPLHLVLVVGATGLEDRLVNTTAAGHNTYNKRNSRAIVLKRNV